MARKQRSKAPAPDARPKSYSLAWILPKSRPVPISVTEAARNFAEYINRAHYQNTTFVLLKNGTPVARIVPDHPAVCTGSDLANLLKESSLSAKEARAWYRDLQSGSART